MAGQQGLDIWYDVSESFAPDDPGIFLGRGGTTNSIANIVHVQGGWVTVPKESDLEDIHIDRAFDGQIVYVSASHELYRVERFIPGFTPDYDLNALPSRSFHSFSWPNADTASHANTASFVDGFVENSDTASFVTNSDTASFVTNSDTASFVTNSDTASFVTNSDTASFVTNSDTASFVTNSDTASFIITSGTASLTSITASGDIMAAGHVSASSFILNGLSFSDSNITSFSGSTQFGVVASASEFDAAEGKFTPAQINHEFTGSLNITGGLFISGVLNIPGHSNVSRSLSLMTASIDDFQSFSSSFSQSVTDFITTSESMAIQITNFTSFSSSFSQSVTDFTTTSESLAIEINNFNSFSSSFSQSVTDFTTTSESLAVEINNFNSFSSSFSQSVTDFTTTSESLAVEINNFNSFSSSFSQSVTDFTTTSESIAVEITSFKSFSSSFSQSVTDFTTTSESIATQITNFQSFSQSFTQSVTDFQAFSSSITTSFFVGNITASNISASGLLFASASLPIHTDSIVAVVYDTHSGQFYYTGSYGEGGVTQTTELEEFSFDSLIVSNINTPFEFVSSQFTASKDDTTLWPEGTGYVDINNSISSVIDNDSSTFCTFSTLVEDAFNFIFTFNEPVILSEIRTEFVKLGEGYALPEQVFLYGKNLPFESGESDGTLLGEGARIGMGEFNNTVFTSPSSNPVSIFGVGDDRNLSRTSSIVETSLTSSFQYYRIRYKDSQLSGTERSDGFVSIKEVTPVTRSFTDKGTSISASNGVLNVNTLVTDNLIGTASHAELANTANSATSASYSLTASFVDGASVNLTNITSNITPSDNTISIGTPTNKFKEIFAIDTFFGGIHEINLETEGLNKMQEGTVLTLQNGMMCPCENEADPLVMGVVSKGENYPIVLGAEPILITGKIKEGDYIITSNIKGHGKGVNPQYIYSKQLFGKIIAQAIESGDGESYTIKAMIRKM